MNSQLTVFTPTYNRAYILPNLYESLKKQTNKGFVWLIVDDGSTDNTKDIVQGWLEEDVIEIRYVVQKNSGKMKAHNVGVKETNSELFFCVDSDDYLVSDAVELILNTWNEIEKIDKAKLSGMIGYKGFSPNKPLGNSFPVGLSRDTLSGFYNKGLSGDTALIFRTEVIAQYPFPIIENEKFITEAFVYNQLDRIYELYAIREVLTICEYRSDGLTQNLLKITFNNPCGYTAYFLQQGNYSLSIKDRFLFYIRASAFARFTKGIDMPIEPSHKIIYIMSIPFGQLFYLYKKRLYDKTQRSNK